LAPDLWDHWYDIIEGTAVLRQGDIFRDLLVYCFPQDLPVVAAPKPGEKINVQGEWLPGGDWIVMSASCDVERPQTYPHVLIGRVLPVTSTNLGTANPKEAGQRHEVIRKGLDPSKFMLAECPSCDFPRSFVQYKTHVTMPAGYLIRHCQAKRLRLRHPFRESFGNWVGANIARVGPETHHAIPPIEDVTVWAAHVLRAAEAD